MRELQLVLSDDLIFAQTGDRVPAEETVVIALDGKTRELDLTAANAKDVRELLAPWMEAGHQPGQQSAAPQRESGKIDIKASRDHSQLIRDFADEHDLRSEDGTRPIYRTPGGGYYYPRKLMQMWEAHQGRGH